MTRACVVIPYFDAQQRLDLVLAALELQTWPADRFEVVVADDGSPVAPELGERPYRTTLVRQPDLGFRAAAARNLGAAAGGGDLLCFLDGDTVPDRGYVAAMVDAVGDGRVLAVGRRRHVDLHGWSAPRLRAWLLGDGPGPDEHPAPQWLADGYSRTDNLTTVGDDGYRFVIGAVLAVPRSLFEAVGGFEESFTEYGGEDWELANRCWLAGADFRHVPDAVAWHDGHDFAGRSEDHVAVKNVEGLATAPFITDPAARGVGLLWAQPDVVVRLADDGWTDAALLLTVASLLRDTDAGIWLSRERRLAPLLDDPRVHVGEPDRQTLSRCRYRVDVREPLALRGSRLRELCAEAPLRLGSALTVRRTRDLNRGHPEALDTTAFAAEPLSDDDLDLERVWGRAARDGW